MIGEKIIIYGMGRRMERSIKYFEKYYKIVGFTDSNINKEKEAKKYNIPFIKPENINLIDYDKIVITSTFVQEIKEKIIKIIGLQNSHKIITDYDKCNEIYQFKYNEIDRNGGRTIAIISGIGGESGGLFFIIHTVLVRINEITNKNFIPVIDMKNYQNQYLETDKIGKENSWEYYFEQPCNISLEESYRIAGGGD